MKALSFIAAALSLGIVNSHAIILFGTSDPDANTTAPGGQYANSGWNLQGEWGDFLGTPISPDLFITAKHIGDGGTGYDENQPAYFNLGGVDYEVIDKIDHPSSNVDLTLWRIDGTFPAYAQLMKRRAIFHEQVVGFGRSGPGGDEVVNEELCAPMGITTYAFRGRKVTAYDGVKRWGAGKAHISVAGGHGGGACDNYSYSSFIYKPFWGDSADDFALYTGDSGGGLFAPDPADGVWKLAGIAYATGNVGPYRYGTGEPQFYAAVTNAGGIQTYSSTFSMWLDSCNPFQTTGVYTDIAWNLDWIYSEIDKIRLTKPYWSGNGTCGLVFEIGGAINGTISIQTSTDMDNWTTASSPSATGYRKVYSDGGAYSLARKFYRVSGPNSVLSENALGFQKLSIDASSSSVSITKFFTVQFTPQAREAARDKVSSILKSPVEGMIVRKWVNGQYEYNTFEFGEWSDPDMTLVVGEGFLLTIPAGETYETVIMGDLVEERTIPLAPSWNMVGYVSPKTVPLSQLQITPVNGDKIHRLVDGSGNNSANWQWQVAEYVSGSWTPSNISIQPGEGFWYQSARGSTYNWAPEEPVW